MAPPRKKARLSADAAEIAADAAANHVDEEMAVTDKSEEKSTEKTQKNQRRSLFVRSLPASTTTETLTDVFSQVYPIKHATAVIDRETKQCKGYGFVTFADAEDCERAKDEFQNFVIDGKKIRVEIAEPRHRDQEGGEAVQTPVQKAKEQREKERTENKPPKLIVRNLPWSIKEPDQLAKLFLSYGKVKHATIPKKKGLMAGFGFVVLRGKKNAEKALAGVNGKEIDGRTLAVDWAVEKETWEGKEEVVEVETDEAGTKPDANGDNEEDLSELEDEELDHELSGLDDEEKLGSDDAEMDDEQDAEDLEGDDMEDDHVKNKTEDKSTTLFIRNLPFSCADEDLDEHFTQFGPVRYSRIVLDHATERPKGTGFVCFYKVEDADECIKNAPRSQAPQPTKGKPAGPQPHSILQNEYADPSGNYTMDGRVLQISRAVEKSEANRLTQEGVAFRTHRDRDKRRLYLLSEGTIASNTPLWESLAPSERTMREASLKQRKTLIESNPSLNLSLTRLSVRNIPRTIDSKDLKQLARDGVVGFAKDLKAGIRQRLSKEELARGGEEMQEAEKNRRASEKGIVKQAKIVFEGREGVKVSEDSGAGRSRGYGFIEYHTHRNALMGLRWLNGHAIDYQTHEQEGKGKKASQEMIQERKKRLIVEFAIENAQVVVRRKEREAKSKEVPSKGEAEENGIGGDGAKAGSKRKRGTDEATTKVEADTGKTADEEKLANRQRIIQKKRMARRARKKGGA